MVRMSQKIFFSPKDPLSICHHETRRNITGETTQVFQILAWKVSCLAGSLVGRERSRVWSQKF